MKHTLILEKVPSSNDYIPFIEYKIEFKLAAGLFWTWNIKEEYNISI